MTSKFPWYVPLLVAAMAACGGETQPVPNEDIAAKWQQYCEKESVRTTACGSTPRTGCADDAACLQGVLRPGVTDTLTSCLLSRACNANDDACFAMAAAPYQSDPVVGAYTTACIDKQAACKQAGMSFSDDFCANAGLFRSDVISQLQACVQGECAQVRSCTDAVGAALGCK